jgi:hypothetical protein
MKEGLIPFIGNMRIAVKGARLIADFLRWTMNPCFLGMDRRQSQTLASAGGEITI